MTTSVAAQEVARNWKATQLTIPDDAVPPVVSALAVSGERCASAGDDHLIRIWNTSTKTLEHTLTGHTGWVRAVKFTSAGQFLVSGGTDRRLLMWDLRDPSRPRELTRQLSPVMDLAVSSDGRWLGCICFDGSLQLWDLNSLQPVHQLRCSSNDTRSVAFSPDGSQIATAGRDGRLHVWSVMTGELKIQQASDGRRVRQVAFLADDTVALGGDGGSPLVCRLQPELSITKMPARQGRIFGLASWGNRHLLSAGSDNVIRVLDIDSGAEVARLEGHTGTVAAIVSQGQTVVTGGYDTTIRIWRPATDRDDNIRSARADNR